MAEVGADVGQGDADDTRVVAVQESSERCLSGQLGLAPSTCSSNDQSEVGSHLVFLFRGDQPLILGVRYCATVEAEGYSQ